MTFIVTAVFAGTDPETMTYEVIAEYHVEALTKFIKIINVHQSLITITEIYEK